MSTYISTRKIGLHATVAFSMSALGVSSCGVHIAPFDMGWAMDKFNPRKVIGITYLLAGLFAYIVGQSLGNITLLATLVLLVGMCINGTQSAMPSLAARFYPTQGRAIAKLIALSNKNTAVILSLLSIGMGSANASDLPPINLGMTSFLDGMPPAGNGLYYQGYFQNYSSDHIRGNNGKDVGLPKTDVNYQVFVNQFIYLSGHRIGNANLGLNVLLPAVTRMNVDDGLDHSAIRSHSGMGDILLGPLLQFDPIMGRDGPRFAQRIEFGINVPTGEYDSKYDINPGNHAWSLDPYWAGTYWFSSKWTASLRAHYLYNFKNNDPGYRYGTASDIQAGQAVHANFATEYAVTPQLRLGINGYWLKQITDTKVDGHNLSGSREKVWAIGPGGVYSFSKDNHVFVNAYFEQGAENRPEGSQLLVRYVHHFGD